MKRKTIFSILRIFTFVLTAVFLGFIFFNSLQSGVESGMRSARVVHLLQSIFDGLHIHVTVSELLIRKLAHFTEFFALGCLLAINIRVLTRDWWARIFVPLFFGILFPVVDETIQLFSYGRSGEVRDVLIDFGGVCAGVLVLTPIIALLFDRRKKT